MKVPCLVSRVYTTFTSLGGSTRTQDIDNHVATVLYGLQEVYASTSCFVPSDSWPYRTHRQAVNDHLLAGAPKCAPLGITDGSAGTVTP